MPMIMPEFSKVCCDLRRVELPTPRVAFARGVAPQDLRFAAYLGGTTLSTRGAEDSQRQARRPWDVKAPVGWLVVDGASLVWVVS